MRILLVGGFGFIGKHLITELGGSDSLIVLSNKEGAEEASCFHWPSQPVVEIGDITDEARVKEVMLKHCPKAVVHLAALTGIKRCNENLSLAFLTNVLGTYNVIMGCAACKSRLIFISSREVYGETTSDRTQEDDPLVPNNIYGITKMLGEMLVKWAASRYNLDYTILRLTNVYGPRGDQYNVQAMIRKALTEGSIQILGGSQRLNLVYVKDAAEAIRRCLADPRASRQTFNVGSGDNISVEEMVSRIVSLLDIPVKIERGPMRVGETLNFRPSLEKMEKMLGYRSATTFTTGLQKTVEWYKQQAHESSQIGWMK